MNYANFYSANGRVLFLIISILLVLVGYGLEALVISTFISQIFRVYFINKKINLIIGKDLYDFRNIRKEYVDEIYAYSYPLFISSLVRFLGSPLHKILITRYVGLGGVAIYELVFKGAMMIRNVIEVNFKALIPKISEMVANKSSSCELIMNWKKSHAVVIMLGSLTYLSVFLFSDKMLILWLGSNFTLEISELFRLMLIATIVNLIGIPSYYFGMGIGEMKLVMKSVIISWSCNFIVIMLMIIINGEIEIKSIIYSLIISWSISTMFLMISIFKSLAGEKTNRYH